MNETIYPSDLTDEEWEWIKDLIPAAKRGGRPRTLCMRAVLNAIFYVTKGGIQWRMLRLSLRTSLETHRCVGPHA
jgi:transposase